MFQTSAVRRPAYRPTMQTHAFSHDAQVPRGYKVRFLTFDKGLNRR